RPNNMYPPSQGMGTACYRPSGFLNSKFGESGKVFTNLGTYSEAYTNNIQDDGKIIVAGISTMNSIITDFGVVRYKTNGTLDSTFGVVGKVNTDFGGDER